MLAAVALVAAGCTAGNSQSASATQQGGSGAPAGSTAPSGGGSALQASGKLFAYGFSYKTGDIIATTRADEFQKKYPDVSVTYSESGFDDQQFVSALASSDKPDVARIPRNKIGTYIARGVLEPMDECFSKSGFDPSVFYDAARNDVTVGGKMYAVPEFFNTRVWFIDNKAFKDAGLNPEELDWSDWNAIADANKKLAKVQGGKVTRIGIDPKLPEFLPLWAAANGGQVLSDDGMESKLDDAKVVEALTSSSQLINDEGGYTAFKDFRDTWDFFGAKNQLAQNQVGAWPQEQWYLNVLAQNSPDVDFTVKPFLTRDGQPITLEDGDSWAIVKGTDNPDAACAFATTMVATDTWIAAAKARQAKAEKDGKPQTGVYSGNREADKVIFEKYVPLSDLPPAFGDAVKVVLDTQEKAFGLPPSPAAAEFQQAMTDAVNRALTGTPPAEALKQADQEAQDAIDAAAR
jgi:multiple sugar transport system substrate-binding protein